MKPLPAALFLLALAILTHAAQAQDDELELAIRPEGDFTIVYDKAPFVLRATPGFDAYVWDFPDAVRGVAAKDLATVQQAPAGRYMVRLTTLKVRVDADGKFLGLDQYNAALTFLVGKGPEPPPGPGPDPPPPAPTGFAAKVKEALTAVDQGQLSAKPVIADIYLAIAGEAANNPNAWDPATMVSEVKVRIGSALTPSQIAGWKGFWPLLSAAMVQLQLQSTDLPGHIQAFETIGTTLKSS